MNFFNIYYHTYFRTLYKVLLVPLPPQLPTDIVDDRSEIVTNGLCLHDIHVLFGSRFICIGQADTWVSYSGSVYS
jgi:hypothetical protein